MAGGFVQAKSGGATVTLDNATGDGNTLVVLISAAGSTTTPSVSAVTLGGAADNFASSGVSVSDTTGKVLSTAWLDRDCASGQTSVAVTASSATVIRVTVIELEGIVTSSLVDKSSAGHSSSAVSWSSGAAATSTQADEVWVGLVGCLKTGSTPSVTGPSSPWINEAATSATSGTLHLVQVAGYQVTTATGAATYAGTVSSLSAYAALVLGLKAAAPVTDTGTGSVRLPKMSLAGTGTETAPGSGRAVMAPMSATGVGDMLPTGTGSAVLPAMRASGADTGALTPFSDLVLHIPGPNAPASLTPFVAVGGGADPPDGREYAVPSLLDGVNARFGGDYSFKLINQSWANPASQRTVTVTVHQHEYLGGPSVSETLSRPLTPATDPTIPSGYVDMGSMTLPIRAIPDQNITAYFTVSVTSGQSGDRFDDVLMLDVQGSTMIIITPVDYSTFFANEPDANVQLGQVLGSAFDLPAAASVLQYAKVSGPPMGLRPGDNIFLAYSKSGPPSLSLTYWPRWYQDALA